VSFYNYVVLGIIFTVQTLDGFSDVQKGSVQWFVQLCHVRSCHLRATSYIFCGTYCFLFQGLKEVFPNNFYLLHRHVLDECIPKNSHLSAQNNVQLTQKVTYFKTYYKMEYKAFCLPWIDTASLGTWGATLQDNVVFSTARADKSYKRDICRHSAAENSKSV
jgi:hypothetical protein